MNRHVRHDLSREFRHVEINSLLSKVVCARQRRAKVLSSHREVYRAGPELVSNGNGHPSYLVRLIFFLPEKHARLHRSRRLDSSAGTLCQFQCIINQRRAGVWVIRIFDGRQNQFVFLGLKKLRGQVDCQRISPINWRVDTIIAWVVADLAVEIKAPLVSVHLNHQVRHARIYKEDGNGEPVDSRWRFRQRKKNRVWRRAFAGRAIHPCGLPRRPIGVLTLANSEYRLQCFSFQIEIVAELARGLIKLSHPPDKNILRFHLSCSAVREQPQQQDSDDRQTIHPFPSSHCSHPVES